MLIDQTPPSFESEEKRTFLRRGFVQMKKFAESGYRRWPDPKSIDVRKSRPEGMDGLHDPPFPTSRILFAAPTNQAVDTLLRRVLEDGVLLVKNEEYRGKKSMQRFWTPLTGCQGISSHWMSCVGIDMFHRLGRGERHGYVSDDPVVSYCFQSNDRWSRYDAINQHDRTRTLSIRASVTQYIAN